MRTRGWAKVILVAFFSIGGERLDAQGIAMPAVGALTKRISPRASQVVTRVDTVTNVDTLRVHPDSADKLRAQWARTSQVSGIELHRTAEAVDLVRTQVTVDTTQGPAPAEPCELHGTGGFLGTPVTKRAEAACFWNQKGLTVLNSMSFSGNGDNRSITVELATDFLGPVRAYVSGLVASADTKEGEESSPVNETAETSDQNAAIQRFLTGGGNTIVGFLMPGPTLRASDGPSGFLVYALAAPRIGIDLPGVGNSTANPKANVDAGAELTAVASADNIGFTVQVRGGYVVGTPEFYSALGREHGSFGYARVNVGMRLRMLNASTVLVSWSKLVSAPHMFFRTGNQLSFSLEPKI